MPTKLGLDRGCTNMSNSVIEINTRIFLNNLQVIRSHIDLINPDTKFCLPVKADAYGHGIIKIAMLAEPLVDYFGVSCLDEGMVLREHGITKPILVFGAFCNEDISGLVKNDLDITVSSLLKAQELAEFCAKNETNCKVHLKIDTGMGRVGVRPENAQNLIDFVLEIRDLQLIGVYSHLACSDEEDREFTNQQIAEFMAIVTYVKAINPNIICHIANSGAVCDYEETFLDMVRPGILSYGYFPRENNLQGLLGAIKPCYTLRSKIVYFKTMQNGQSISYNRSYFTHSFTRVVTIAIGYGDGYKRCLSNIGSVIIRGKKYTISGTICMDMLIVDIGADGEGYVGDSVTLIGEEGNHMIRIEELAVKCGTNVYEILCSFTNRVPRIYI